MTIEQTVEILPDHRLEFALPVELPVGRARVELTITPEMKGSKARTESAFGCLSHFVNPSKISGEEGAWARLVFTV